MSASVIDVIDEDSSVPEASKADDGMPLMTRLAKITEAGEGVGVSEGGAPALGVIDGV